jgi:hypothetical protein
MNAGLAATLVIAVLFAPVAGHAADANPVKESIKENAGDPVITTRIRAEYAKDQPVKITRDSKVVSSAKGENKVQSK